MSRRDTHTHAPRQLWLAVVSLAVSSFSLVTAEFLPVGLLGPIAQDLGVSIGTAGWLVAMPALLAALAAPSLTIFAARRDRRKILLALTALLAASMLLSIFAASWTILLAARMVLGIAVGGFWAIGASLPGRMMPPQAVGRATSIVYMGSSVGIVLGVPIGTLIGQHYGWRVAFALSSATAILAFASQWWALPHIKGNASLRARDLVGIVRQPATIIALFVTMLAVGTQFGTYTFIEPFLTGVTGVSASIVAAALLAYGAAGLIGSMLGGFGADRSLAMTLNLVLLTTMAALAGLYLFGTSALASLTLILAWGVAFGALPLCLQLWSMRLAYPQIEAGSALFVGFLQISIAAGSAAGGMSVDRLGLHNTMGIGASIFVLALILGVLARNTVPPAQPNH